jgi:hypothetical protein
MMASFQGSTHVARLLYQYSKKLEPRNRTDLEDPLPLRCTSNGISLAPELPAGLRF